MTFDQMKLEIRHLIDASSDRHLLHKDICDLLDNYKSRKFMKK